MILERPASAARDSPARPLWQGLAVGTAALVGAWVLLVMGLVNGMGEDDVSPTRTDRERVLCWSFAAVLSLGSGLAAAHLTSRRLLLLVPVVPAVALGAGWLGAWAT